MSSGDSLLISPLVTDTELSKLSPKLNPVDGVRSFLLPRDISIFCREPTEEEQDEALTLIPEAVIEVVSKGYEAKDLEIGPPFYLSQGVKDVIVFDPATLLVLHVRKDHVMRSVAPVEIALQYGGDSRE